MTAMNLHEEVRLPLPPGTYRLDARQNLDADVTDGDQLDSHQRFLVIDVPRVSMSGSEIFSVSPPPNALGPYAGRLAQITLRRRALPWARSGDAGPPWLALIVLADGEGDLITDVPVVEAFTDGVYDSLDEAPPSETRADTLEVLESVVQRVFPARAELPLTCHVREVRVADTEYADEDGWVSVVIANRLPQPGMRYRAHLISLEGQHDVLPSPGRVASDVPMRWAVADKVLDLVTTAGAGRVAPHLVDLVVRHAPTTGIDLDLLGIDAARVTSFGALPIVDARGDVRTTTGRDRNDDSATSRARRARANADHASEPNAARLAVSGLSVAGLFADLIDPALVERRYRFPVLAHWEFECSDDGKDFSGYMTGLAVGMIGSTSTGPGAPEVAATGHVRLDHTDRQGVAQRSWYRGPFAPAPITRAPADTPTHVADQLLAVTEDGSWDTSYASAFEIGRLLAMSDLQFLRSLRAYARAGFVLRRSVELHGEAIAHLTGADMLLQVRNLGDAVRRVLDRALVPGGLGVDPLVALGQPRPIHDGPDFVDPVAQIGALSIGFGLPADAVRATLAPGPTDVVIDPSTIGGGRAFDDVVAGGIAAELGAIRGLAVAERLGAIRSIIDAAGGADAAAGRLRELLEEGP